MHLVRRAAVATFEHKLHCCVSLLGKPGGILLAANSPGPCFLHLAHFRCTVADFS